VNITPHPSIPGLYNAWDGVVFSTILAMNLPDGRVWRTKAHRSDGQGEVEHVGDFATRAEAVKAIEKWSNTSVLKSIIAGYHSRVDEFERCMQENVPGFSREVEEVDDQPCADEHMGIYDEICADRDAELAIMLSGIIRKLERIVSGSAS
jgi:hypothetical protein